MTESEAYALEISGLNDIPDDEERYYQSVKCLIYDTAKKAYEEGYYNGYQDGWHSGSDSY